MVLALVLDDDPGVLRALARYLGVVGTVFTARTCREARAVLASRTTPIDVAVVDEVLGVDRGSAFLLEQEERLSTASRFVISGHDDPGIRARARAAGAQFFSKLDDLFYERVLVAAAVAARAPTDAPSLSRIGSELAAKYRLTVAERDLLLDGVLGADMKETAERRRVSITTVKTQRQSLLRKMNASDIALIRRQVLARVLRRD